MARQGRLGRTGAGFRIHQQTRKTVVVETESKMIYIIILIFVSLKTKNNVSSCVDMVQERAYAGFVFFLYHNWVRQKLITMEWLRVV